MLYFQRKVDLRRHKETQHTDLRILPSAPSAHTTAALTRPTAFNAAANAGHINGGNSTEMIAAAMAAAAAAAAAASANAVHPPGHHGAGPAPFPGTFHSARAPLLLPLPGSGLMPPVPTHLTQANPASLPNPN